MKHSSKTGPTNSTMRQARWNELLQQAVAGGDRGAGKPKGCVVPEKEAVRGELVGLEGEGRLGEGTVAG